MALVFDRDYGAWVEYNPVQKAMAMASPGWEWQEPAISAEEKISARLRALEEMLGELDPNDWIGRIYIRNEMEQLRARLARQAEGITARIGNIQEQMLSAAAQEAEHQQAAELAAWGIGSLAGQYPAVTPQTWAIGAMGPTEEYSASTTPIVAKDWMRGITTPMGLRPVIGDYVMDPNQRRQAEYWQLYMQSNKPRTIEEWLKLTPQVETISEQWRKMAEETTPRRRRSVTNWIAAAAR